MIADPPPGSMLARAGKLRIVFLHHSVGRFLIRHGGVRALLAARNRQAGTAHEFWDHDYNSIGLSGPDGAATGESFAIPNDSTDPPGLDILFSQPVHDPPDNALGRLLGFDVIVVKSCFPACAIRSEVQLEGYQRDYKPVRAVSARYPEKLFIMVTPPPLVRIPGLPRLSADWTTAAEGRRARRFARWLGSEAFLAGRPNLATFDLFDLLAVPEGRPGANGLRPAYRARRLWDAHPTVRGYRAVAAPFVDFLWQQIGQHQARLAAHPGAAARDRC